MTLADLVGEELARKMAAEWDATILEGILERHRRRRSDDRAAPNDDRQQQDRRQEPDPGG